MTKLYTILKEIKQWQNGYIIVSDLYKKNDYDISWTSVLYYGNYTNQGNKLQINYSVCKIVAR
jgi:hypothetical protein